MPNGEPWDDFFHPTLTVMVDSYIIEYRFLLGNLYCQEIYQSHILLFSCTPDRDFRCFYPFKIILSHIARTNPWKR